MKAMCNDHYTNWQTSLRSEIFSSKFKSSAENVFGKFEPVVFTESVFGRL
jgi:hypothetical protein